MPERLVMRRIVLPQAVRIVIPAIGNEFIAMIKDSSLVSILAVEELLFRARLVGQQNFRSLEALLIAAAIYWILTILFSHFQQRLERRMARERPMTTDGEVIVVRTEGLEKYFGDNHVLRGMDLAGPSPRGRDGHRPIRAAERRRSCGASTSSRSRRSVGSRSTG